MTQTQFNLLCAIGASQSIAEIPAIYFRALEDARFLCSDLRDRHIFNDRSHDRISHDPRPPWAQRDVVWTTRWPDAGGAHRLSSHHNTPPPQETSGVASRGIRLFAATRPTHSRQRAHAVGVDRWALELAGLRYDLGLYTLASQLASGIPIATNAWNEASSPRFLATWRDGGVQSARIAFRRITAGFVIVGIGALVATMCALLFLGSWSATDSVPPFSLVPAIGGSLVIGGLFSSFINVLFFQKKTSLIPVLTLASVGINVAFNLLLVPRWHVWGAIAGTGIALSFRSTIMLAFALRGLREHSTAPRDSAYRADESRSQG